jgi:hypothetical protein
MAGSADANKVWGLMEKIAVATGSRPMIDGHQKVSM